MIHQGLYMQLTSLRNFGDGSVNCPENTEPQEESGQGTLEWNYFICLSELQVAFNAFKNQLLSDIALDDISLTYGICNTSLYPEPTLVPTLPPEHPSK